MRFLFSKGDVVLLVKPITRVSVFRGVLFRIISSSPTYFTSQILPAAVDSLQEFPTLPKLKVNMKVLSENKIFSFVCSCFAPAARSAV